MTLILLISTSPISQTRPTYRKRVYNIIGGVNPPTTLPDAKRQKHMRTACPSCTPDFSPVSLGNGLPRVVSASRVLLQSLLARGIRRVRDSDMSKKKKKHRLVRFFYDNAVSLSFSLFSPLSFRSHREQGASIILVRRVLVPISVSRDSVFLLN